MQHHITYWRDLLQRGTAVLFGPVADPSGSYGIAVIRLAPGADPGELGKSDPAVKAGLGFGFEIHPMPQAVVAGGGVG